MKTGAFWVAFYAVVLPLGVIAMVLSVVRYVRETFGEPELDGRILYEERNVPGRCNEISWPAQRHVWITDRMLVLRTRWDYGSFHSKRIHTFVQRQIQSVRRDGAVVYIDLVNAGEQRKWALQSSHPERLYHALRALQDAGGTPTPQ